MYKYSDYGLAPEQYHAGIDKLWTATGLNGVQDNDIFTISSALLNKRNNELLKTLCSIRIAIELLPDYSDKDWSIQPDNLRCDVDRAKIQLKAIINYLNNSK